MFLCLSKGQIECAIYYNVFAMMLIFISIPYLIYKIYKYIRYDEIKISKVENIIVYIMITAALIFGVIRNFETWPLY